MKIDRLIGIITILLQQEKITAPQLAKRFEVSRRTINRDIESICRAGIPIVTTQGHGGGISIAEGYKIDKSLFTNDELQMLFAGLKGVDSISAASHSAALLEKLSSNGKAISNDFIIIDLASHYKEPLTQKIDILKNSVTNRHIISFKYCCGKGESLRKIEPYYIVFKWSSWYIFGYCLKRQTYRLFKLNRLWDLEDTKECFEPREIPQEELCFENYFKKQAIRLKALFPLSEKYRLVEEYGINSYTALEDGKLLFEHTFVNYNNMKQWVFSFGDKVSVLKPQKLINDRILQAQNILKYQKQHDLQPSCFK